MDGRTTPEANRPAIEAAGPRLTEITTREIASYTVDLVRGIRTVVMQAERGDLAFLDYLLAMAEDEASTLADNTRH